jgi:hypothetical protein
MLNMSPERMLFEAGLGGACAAVFEGGGAAKGST